MASQTAILAVRIISDAKKATEGFNHAETAVGKFQSGLTKAAVGATAVVGGLVAMGKNAADSASGLQQASGAVDSVFGKQAGAVHELARAAANSVGLAQSEYSTLASVLGAQLSNLGVSQGELVGTTDNLISTGADLAATYGGTTKEAVEALGAAFRGETDPIERYGISIKQADVEARMAKDGTDKLTGAARKQAETQARLALIQEQSTAAAGQFAREQDSAAGSAQIAAANYENAKAALGESLLPAMTKGAQTAAQLAKHVQENAGAFTALAAAVGIIAGLILTAQAASMAYSVVLGVQALAQGTSTAALTGNSIALGAYAVAAGVVKVATAAWSAVQWALNAALSANPIGIVVIAIAALVAGIIWAWNNVAWFRDGIIAAWEWIKTASIATWEWIKNAIGLAWQGIVWAFKNLSPVGIIITHWDKIKAGAVAAWTWIKAQLGRLWRGAVWVFKNLSPVGIIITHWSQIKTRTIAVWNSIVAWFGSMWTRLTGSFRTSSSRIVSNLVGAWNQARSRTNAAFNALVAGIRSRISSAVNAAGEAPRRITALFRNMGGMLRNSGWNLIIGFANGIRRAGSHAASAARDVLNRVRNFFPFSPAKEGPFSGAGYTTHSGRALVTDFAGAMVRNLSDVRRAAAAVATAGAINGRYSIDTRTATAGTAGRAAAVPQVVIERGAIQVTGLVTNPDATGEAVVKLLDSYFRRRGLRWR